MIRSTPHAGVPAEVEGFMARAPRPEFVEAFVLDVNAIARGKRLPAGALPRLYGKGLCLPASTLVLDVWGREVDATGLVLETGDADCFCRPVAGSLRPLPWSERAGGQVLLQMLTADGEPFHADPRNVLAAVVARFGALGLTPVVATELEFRLFEETADGVPRTPARVSQHGRRSQLYGLDELADMGALFAEIDRACEAQGLPADTIIAEQSEGQYEINLEHVADPLLAADQAVLLKRTIKAVARRHGLTASFMAKPLGDESGNGMHVHMSLVDKAGHNVFAGTGAAVGSDTLMHALAGLSATMIEATAVFAPHANSYRRFQAGSHVPMAPTWGVDNRTVALRVPLAEPEATRIEHRVAGADANPYLVLAALLGGIHHGIVRKLDPPPPTRGNAYQQHTACLPDAWGAALDRFERSAFIAEYLGEEYRRLFTACKRQERERLRRVVPHVEYDTYLGTI